MCNHAPNPQCNKCSRDVMIIVAGKVATAVFSIFTKKINYLHLCGQLWCSLECYKFHNSFYVSFNSFKSVVKWRCCDSRVQHRFQNITCRAWQAASKVYLPMLALPLVPQPCLTKVSYIARTLPKDISCRAGQVRVLFCLPDCRFLPNSLATGQVVICCTLDRLKS